MYNNYTPLQQRQLALQEYSNTQSTYLPVSYTHLTLPTN